MSGNLRQYEAHVARLLTLTPLEQKMCVSMLGLDVWRMYREQGIQVSMLIELHTPKDEFDAFTWGIAQVLQALPKTERFNTLDALCAELAQGIAKIGNRNDRMVASTYHCGIDVRVMAEQYGVDWIDVSEAQWAGELATFMLDCVFQNSAKSQGFEPWVQVWFELCDTALPVYVREVQA